MKLLTREEYEAAEETIREAKLFIERNTTSVAVNPQFMTLKVLTLNTELALKALRKEYT